MNPDNRNNIYIFSGLGADERVFRNMSFGNWHPIFIHWETPEPGESLEAYAAKLLPQIKNTDPVLLGLSFGGIIAQEVSALMPVRQLILLASISSGEELPWYYRLAGKLGLHRRIPAAWLKHYNPFSAWFFGADTREQRLLLRQILQDTDTGFLAWAISRILAWQAKAQPAGLVRIHGSKDRILPLRFVSCDIGIRGGGHFMTLDKAAELSCLLEQILGSLRTEHEPVS